MLYVMKRDSSNVGGFHRCGIASTTKQAQSLVKAHTTYCNGKPFIVPQVWDQRQYDAWHKSEIMPWYREV